jgi:hypothetical protein
MTRNAMCNSVTNAVRNATPVPTRPDPSRPVPSYVAGSQDQCSLSQGSRRVIGLGGDSCL